ncbi:MULTISPECIES: hypothetical protein [unclassified Novosphingobium]|uniref:hypothetical protein n=1 Tax=unclassified Novosphingobium TaxID=2644732 RepID=UPI0013587A2F|nr:MULTISPECIES: hypothetical protein [unclassified Novosphingobium]
MLDIYGANRRQLLTIASTDTLKWLVGPDDMVDTCHSDQFWIREFASEAPPVGIETVRMFLSTFRLTQYTQWDRPVVGTLVDDLRRIHDFDSCRDIPNLSKSLRAANHLNNRQTSAASKIANFTFPSAENYIWDSLATKSVRLREKLAGRRPDAYTPGGEHDYPAYHAACRRAFEREMGQDDFTEQACLVTARVRAIPGPLADPQVPDAFFQRRLLDKLMFHEGSAIKNGSLPEPV